MPTTYTTNILNTPEKYTLLPGKITFQYNWTYGGYKNGGSCTVKFYNDTTDLYTYTSSYPYNAGRTTLGTDDITQPIEISRYSATSTMWTGFVNYQNKLRIVNEMAFQASRIIGKPRELQNIGIKASTTIFGVHTDNTRVSQDS